MSDSNEICNNALLIGTVAEAWSVFISTHQVGNNGRFCTFARQTEKKQTVDERYTTNTEWARQYETNTTWRAWLMSDRIDCLIRRE